MALQPLTNTQEIVPACARRVVDYHLAHCVQIRDALNGIWPLPAPASLIVNPVQGCNLSCNWCSYGLQNKRKYFCDVDRMAGIISRFVDMGSESIEVSGFGEPLLHPQFDVLCEKLHGIRESVTRVRFGLITNGALVDSERACRLVSMFDWIRISIYENAVKDQYESICKLLLVKSSRCILGLKFSITDLNSIRFMLEACDVLPVCDQVSAKLVSGYDLDSECKDILQSSEVAISRGISVDIESPRRISNFWCWLAPLQVTIDPYCNLHYCCNCQFEDRRIREKWGSEEHLDMIRNMRGNKVLSCFGNRYAKCRYLDYHRAVESLIGRPQGVREDMHKEFL